MSSVEATDKRDAILKTALALFTGRGFYGTPTAMISREAGVATGTLFFYFKTKEELIDTLYRQIKSLAAAALREGVDREPTVKAKIRKVGKNALAWAITHPDEFRFMEQFAHSPFVSTTAHEEGMSHFLFLEQLVRDGVREGTLRECDTWLLCSVLASSLSGLTARIMESPDPGEREILARQGLLFIWNGIAAHPDGESCEGTHTQTTTKKRSR
ncbi:MAG: TetR/AcrR family transcriptional regulator [Methanoregula sp.]|uniref:TetR/AcrR family transcriptional regulator n=1 Tax=Methanoregula sp. TaxID=2052170 RepID=UPI003C72CA69